MKATFNNQAEIEVIESIETETEKVVSNFETFQKDEEIDVDLVDDNGHHYYVQFGNGDVAYIPKHWLNVTHLEDCEIE